MKKYILLAIAIFQVWTAWSQPDKITFEGFINQASMDLKQYAHEIHWPDSVEIRIKGAPGVNYSASGFTAKYFSIKGGKEERQTMLFRKQFARKFKLNFSKISFKVMELQPKEDSYKIEIVLNNISYWDSKIKNWVTIAMHPSKRTFSFLLYR